MKGIDRVVSLFGILVSLGCTEFGDPSAPSPSENVPTGMQTGEDPSAPPPPAATTVLDGGAPPLAGEDADPIPEGGMPIPTTDAPVGNAAEEPVPPGDCHVTFATGESRCTVTPDHAECAHVDSMIGGRLVYSQTPVGAPPAGGFPAVVVYQGSIYGPTMTWSGDSTLPFGGFNQIKLQAMLLDNGFVVIAPSADGVAWNTNFPGYEVSSDSRFIPTLIEEIGNGTFGPVDMERLYATGISSGGYMTSRMAVSYAGTFRALAIESGSYATCSNVLCTIPNPLPSDHPPTLFLHGQNDVAVPIATAQAYEAQLHSQGLEALMLVDPSVGHQWLEVAPEAITCWFMEH